MLRAAILIHGSEVRPLHAWILPIPPGALTKISTIPPFSILRATTTLQPLRPSWWNPCSVRWWGLWWATSQCRIVLITREHGLQSVQWCTNHPTRSAIGCKLAFPDASQSHACSCSSSIASLYLPLILCMNVVLVRLSPQRMKRAIQKDTSPPLLYITPSFVCQPTRGRGIPGTGTGFNFTAARHGAPIYQKSEQTIENIMKESNISNPSVDNQKWSKFIMDSTIMYLS